MARWRTLGVALGVAAAVVAADQVTKSLAVAHLAGGPVHVIGPLSLALARNTGSAFSLFTGDAPELAALAAVLVVVLVVVAMRVRSRWAAAAVGLVLGGALGNLADRLFRGHHGGVVDFVSLTFWPTFNLADSAIVVGIIVLILLLLRHPHRPAGRP